MNEINSLQAIYSKYLEAILKGDVDTASLVVKTAFNSGIALKMLHVDVISAAQIALGDLWARGELTIAQEHIATEISMLQLNWLRFHAVRRAALNLDVLVAVPYSEQHIFPARLIADQLLLDGWNVHFPGINTPSDDLTEFIKQKKIDLVAFSLTLKPDRSFAKLLKQIKLLPKPPLIVVGGRSAGHVKDLIEVDIHNLVSIEELKQDPRFHGPDAYEVGFTQLKNSLGQRITTLRQERHMSQQRLAVEAKIDRAYLSALENGKQNPSMHVLYRIAAATGVNVGDLMTL